MARLTDAQIAEELEARPRWAREGDSIRREITFPTFPDAVAFVVRVGFEAEAADHHPVVVLNYRRVTLVYSTHSENGLTRKDFQGAAAADAILS
jgi:4a-hydroxytetrahydrobiopterin dehydratase